MKQWGFWAAGVVVWCGAAMAGPISNMTFEEAVEKSRAEGGWLLVAPFSPECNFCELSLNQLMSSAMMQRWQREGVTVIRVNIREDFGAARALRVGQMPAYIVFKDGVEVDRAGGELFRVEEAATWLSQVLRGDRRHARLLEEARSRGEKHVNVDRRQKLAEELVAAGEYELAREEYVWLWRNMTAHAPAMAGVRGSFMAGRMEKLAELDRESREAFCALRDEAEAELKGEGRSWTALDDWLALNEVVGDDDRTLAWFDRVKDTPEGKATIARVGYRLEQILKKRNAWANLAAAYPNPLAAIRQRHAMRNIAGVEKPAVVNPLTGEVEDFESKMFQSFCADLYAANLAAGRDEDAGKIAGLARELDGSPKMIVALVELALEIGQEREAHLEMLEAARAKGADVTKIEEQVRAALKSRS